VTTIGRQGKTASKSGNLKATRRVQEAEARQTTRGSREKEWQGKDSKTRQQQRMATARGSSKNGGQEEEGQKTWRQDDKMVEH
jgi:hypothetical protein